MGEGSDDTGNFLNIEPIARPEEDRFGRQRIVMWLAGLIRGRRDPRRFVLSLYEAWGTGRSSVLTPWYFAGESLFIRNADMYL
jgi:hypothetical protein